MMNLFEYQNNVKFDESLLGLESFLDEIWQNREKSSFYLDNDESKIESQRFLQFIHKTKELKSNKYVGVIHYQGNKINLLPKIFYQKDKSYNSSEIYQIQNHILWWLSYCRKIKFPNYQASLSGTNSDFFEVLIYLFSKYTRILLNSSIFQQYEEVTRELPFIKGRLNVNKYINENLSRGRWHKLNCTYDAFVIDNEFNRIIKHVTNMLFNVTTSYDNKKYLREILFILDEVTDEPATAAQCARIKFNPMFGEFETVRDYCQLFLSHSVSFDYKNDMKLFAFLLPMEYVFEDFVFGFIAKELKEISAQSQKSNTYLDVANNFKLMPDLWIETGQKTLIADTKYKIVYSDEEEPKKRISQSDLYQMVSYAIRFKVDEIILFYPNTINENPIKVAFINIEDTFAENKSISIKAFQIPVINTQILFSKLDTSKRLDELFESTKIFLRNELEGILNSK